MIVFQCHSNCEGRYSFFSNYSYSPFWYVVPAGCKQGESVHCEHANKALFLTKASVFNNTINFDLVSKETDAEQCQKLGRDCLLFDEGKWQSFVDDVAFQIVLQKFTSHPDMVEVLLSTGDAQIRNAVSNPLWGWPGRNVQGEALMRVRAELRQR